MKQQQPKESALELYERGLRQELGNGAPQDFSAAYECYAKAALWGHSLAAWRQGLCLEWGRGVKRDLSLAAKCYRAAADGGCGAAQLRYAQLLLAKKNDDVPARQWLERAADNGIPEAMFLLGKCLENGIGGSVDEKKAADLYRKAADAGCASAQKLMAERLLNGIGVQADGSKALYWLRMAADQKDRDAQFMLGMEYLHGSDVEKNASKAVDWLMKAAEAGHSQAALELGICFANGIGVKRDLAEAAHFSGALAKTLLDDSQKAIKQEAERKEAERKEAERKEAERKEAERKEAERKEAERKEAERKEAERKEAERKEAERKESERKEAERKEAERKEAERKEAERKEAERKEAARKEAERKKAAANLALESSGYRQGRQLLDKGDAEGAFKSFKKGADSGDSACSCALGECYERGIGCDPDSDKASMLIRDAADGGNPRAKLLIGKYEFTMPDDESTVSLQENFELPWAGLSMRWCSSGRFQMGSPGGWLLGGGGEKGRNDNETRHDVRLTTGFWLGQYPVTQKTYASVAIIGGLQPSPSQFKGDDLPVETISWEDAVVWCKILTDYEMAAGRLPDNYAYRLPTEAEWEYACRAGTASAFNDGSSLQRSDGICEALQALAWFRDNSNELPHPVGQLKPNAWGFYDMHGNVSEWCLDKFVPYVNHASTDPLGRGDESVQRRVRRGGSWQDAAKDCRSASRIPGSLNFRRSFIGFRVALAPMLDP